jgi:hypothetical protein
MTREPPLTDRTTELKNTSAVDHWALPGKDRGPNTKAILNLKTGTIENRSVLRELLSVIFDRNWPKNDDPMTWTLTSRSKIRSSKIIRRTRLNECVSSFHSPKTSFCGAACIFDFFVHMIIITQNCVDKSLIGKSMQFLNRKRLFYCCITSVCLFSKWK